MEMNPNDFGFSTAGRVLLIALDGATCDVLMPLAELGVMPNVARLLRTSALVQLKPVLPASGAVAWTTLQSGCTPAGHGVLDDFLFDHHRRKIIPRGAHPLRVPVLADVVSAHTPDTPAVCIDDGIDVAARVDPRPTNFDQLCERIARFQTAMYRAVVGAQQADQTTNWRLLQVRFRSLDRLQHQLWNLLGLKGQPGGNRQWAAKTQEAFRTLDRCLGDLLKLAEQRRADVALVSAYGFVPLRERITLSELLRRENLLHLATGPAALRYRMARWTWKAKRWVGLSPWATRSALGVCPADWNRTRAITLHGQFGALVYLNTPERFGTRVLATATQREQAGVEVMGALAEARHPVTGQPLFTEVYRTDRRFECDPVIRFWPEIVAVPASGFHVRHRPDRRRHLVRCDSSLAATHGGSGLFMLRADGIALGRPREANAEDVAPTILHLLGIAPEPTMQGRVLEELFVDRWHAAEY